MVIHSRIQDPCEGELCNNSYCRKPLNIVEKLSILDVCRSLGYASVIFPAPTKEHMMNHSFLPTFWQLILCLMRHRFGIAIQHERLIYQKYVKINRASDKFYYAK